jgi:hypothetical protein
MEMSASEKRTENKHGPIAGRLLRVQCAVLCQSESDVGTASGCNADSGAAS